MGNYCFAPEILSKLLKIDQEKTTIILQSFSARNIKRLRGTLFGSLLLKDTKIGLKSDLSMADWESLQDLFQKYVNNGK